MFTRWQPLSDVRAEMNQLHHEMNRLFGRYAAGGRDVSTGYPPLNLWEDDSHLYVEAELPGFQLDDLEIYVTGENQLSMKGQRRQPELGAGTWHRQERGFGMFRRTLSLPVPVESDSVSAEFQHGVLTIKMPKVPAAQPRRIAVKCND